MADHAARILGLEAERKAIQAGLGEEGALSTMSRTDAIVTVLRKAGGTMSPTDIVNALQAAGRSDDLRSVTATLSYLMKNDSVQRPSPGRYLVP